MLQVPEISKEYSRRQRHSETAAARHCFHGVNHHGRFCECQVLSHSAREAYVSSMNEWLTRALVSIAAGTASTVALISSARRKTKGPPPRAVRERRKADLSSSEPKDTESLSADAPGEQPSMSDNRKSQKKGARQTSVASDDMRNYEPGMTTEELKSSLTGARQSVAGFVRSIAGKSTKGSDTQDGHQESANSTGDPGKQRKRRSARREKPPLEGLDLLKEEAMFLAKDAVKRKVVEASGMDKAVDSIQKGAATLREKGEDLTEKLREHVPEDLSGKISSATDELKSASRKLSSSIADTDGLKDSLDDGFQRFGRFLEGPGAQNYRRRNKAIKGKLDLAGTDIVEAKIVDDDLSEESPPSESRLSAVAAARARATKASASADHERAEAIEVTRESKSERLRKKATDAVLEPDPRAADLLDE